MVKHVGLMETDAGEAVEFRVLPPEVERRGRRVHPLNHGSPRAGSVQPEPAGVAKSIEHGAARGVPGGGPAVFPLVQIKAGLLAFRQIHQVAQAGGVLDGDRRRRGRAAKRPVVQFHALQPADAAFRAQIDANGAGQFGQDVGDFDAPLGQAEGRELDRQPAVVTVHRQAGKAVAFAEYESAGAAGSNQAQDVSPQADRGGQTITKERAI